MYLRLGWLDNLDYLAAVVLFFKTLLEILRGSETTH